MKVYFKNEKKPICIEIFIHSLKYINIFNFVHEVRQKVFICFTVLREPRHQRTTAQVNRDYTGEVKWGRALWENKWGCAH
jgi:hypothetical protein